MECHRYLLKETTNLGSFTIFKVDDTIFKLDVTIFKLGDTVFKRGDTVVKLDDTACQSECESGKL